jgi:hypothetical protein
MTCRDLWMLFRARPVVLSGHYPPIKVQYEFRRVVIWKFDNTDWHVNPKPKFPVQMRSLRHVFQDAARTPAAQSAGSRRKNVRARKYSFSHLFLN